MLGVSLLFVNGSYHIASAAGGGGGQLAISPTVSSLTVGGTATFTVTSYDYTCPNDTSPSTQDAPFTCQDGSTSQKAVSSYNPWAIAVDVSGSGNTIGGTQAGPHYSQTVVIGNNGTVQFTVTSSVAEAKTVKIFYDYPWGTSGEVSASLTFKAAAATPTTPTPTTPTPRTTTPAVTPTPESTPPATPTSKLEVGGKEVTATTAVALTHDQPLVLKGTTVPNGKVKLFIFSTPREASVVADASGNWTYEVKGLESGDHHIEAEVTDPVTNKTSARATLATFSVAKPVARIAQESTAAKTRGNAWIWIVAVSVLILAGVGVWWYLRRRRMSRHTPSTPQPPEPPLT